MFPCEFRRGEVAQKTEVVGAASVDPDDRSKDAPTVTTLPKFAFDGPLLVGRRDFTSVGVASWSHASDHCPMYRIMLCASLR